MPLFQISSLEQTHHPNMRFSSGNVNVILKKFCILYTLSCLQHTGHR